MFTYFSMLGRFPLGEPDEPRYAEIAREMLDLHDWVTPHLNYVKYFEKPPLIYWLTALNLRWLGLHEFAVRLWPAVFGVLTIVMAYVLGRSMYGRRVGYVAAAVLATAPLHFGLSQSVILDMPLSALMALALGSFWFAYNAGSKPASGQRRRLCVWLLYAATGLAVLTKGPVAVLLTAGIIVAFLLLAWDLSALRWLLSPLGVTIFLAITLPWFMLVSRRNPEFLEFFFVDQHLKRFLSPDEHQQPVWFFVPIVLAGLLPWSAMVLFAPGMVGRFLLRVLTRRSSAAANFCLLWAIVVFTFFSLSASKLGTYVLPLCCPAAILIARFLDQLIVRQHAAPLRRGYIVLLVLAAVTMLGALVTGEVVDQWQAVVIVPYLWIGSVVLAGFASAALLLARRGALPASLATVVFGMLALFVVAGGGRAAAFEFRPLAMAIRSQARPEDLVINYRHYVQGITFYAQRRTVSARGWGELDFGSHQGDQRAFFWKTDAELLQAWASSRRLFLVINRVELEPLRPLLHPAPREIAGYGKKVVVVNFPPGNAHGGTVGSAQ